MRTLVWDNSFKRAFKRLIRKNPQLKTKILVVLELLLENPYNPTLKAHKLKGKLDGLWACWVEYDCRIIYTFKLKANSGSEFILLIDIGTHDEVY